MLTLHNNVHFRLTNGCSWETWVDVGSFHWNNSLCNFNIRNANCQCTTIVSGHSVCWRFGLWDPGFESCIQRRKTTCLPSVRKPLAYAIASKLTATNMYVCMHVWTCVYIHIYTHMNIYNRTCLFGQCALLNYACHRITRCPCHVAYYNVNISENAVSAAIIIWFTALMGPLLLAWFNFNPSMDK